MLRSVSTSVPIFIFVLISVRTSDFPVADSFTGKLKKEEMINWFSFDSPHSSSQPL